MKREQKKQQILAHAAEHFSRFSFQKTTMQDIAGQMGMTKGNLYVYFESKDAIYRQVVEQELIKWRMYAAAQAMDIADPVQKLYALCEAAFSYIRDCALLRGLARFDPGIFSISRRDDRFKQINKGAAGLLRDTLEEGMRAGVFIGMDVEIMTRYLFSTYMMLLIQGYAYQLEDVDGTYREFLKILVRGIIKEGGMRYD